MFEIIDIHRNCELNISFEIIVIENMKKIFVSV